MKTFDLIFVVLFTAELGVNMFGNLWIDFFMDTWNYFDTFVVIVSLVAAFAEENPGLVSLALLLLQHVQCHLAPESPKCMLLCRQNVLRMVRAFRVFRLFRRLKSLGQIMVYS